VKGEILDFTTFESIMTYNVNQYSWHDGLDLGPLDMDCAADVIMVVNCFRHALKKLLQNRDVPFELFGCQFSYETADAYLRDAIHHYNFLCDRF
jgi:hypothetical protein